MGEVLRESQQQVLTSLADAAARLGVSVKTLRRLVDRGEVPHYRFGIAIRVNVAEILEATKERCKPCPSTNVATPTISTSRSRTAGDSGALLRHLIAKQRRNSTTN
jgi:excisionase family DNA binding protein